MKQSFRRFELSKELASELLKREQAGHLTDQDRRHQIAMGRFRKEVRNNLGIPDCTLVTSVSIVVKAMTKHSVAPSTIADLPDLLQQPAAAYHSATERDSIVVVTLEQKGRGSPLLVPFKVNVPDSANKPNIHWMSSAYEKDDPNILAKWGNAGLLIWERTLLIAA
jgi:hypothetical protein